MTDPGLVSDPSLPKAPRPASTALRRDVVRFGPFEADLRSFELSREGRPVKLQPQPFRVLAALVRRRGELVTRDELRREVWGEHTAVDFEHGLNFCVKQVRIALGDSAEHPSYVETLPRRGYRFIAAITSPPARDDAQAAEPAPDPTLRDDDDAPLAARSADGDGAPTRVPSPVPAPSPGRFGRPARRAWILALVAATALAALATLFVLRGRARLVARGSPSVLVVLPFANLTGDPSADALCEGLADDAIHALTTLDPERVAVLAPTTSMALRGRGALDVAREVHADYVVVGALRGAPGQLRVRADLVRARDGRAVWGDAYDAGDGDVASAERALGGSIAEALALHLDPEVARVASPRAATDALRRARYLGRKHDADALPRVLAAYEEAVRLDATNADALAELAMADADAAGPVPPREAMARARDAADRAVALAPRNALAHVARGLVALQDEWDWTRSEASFTRAIALKPGLATAHHMFAAFLSAAGRHGEAMAAIRRAQALDPLSPGVVADAGWHAYLARDYAAAVTELTRTLELEPDDRWSLEHRMNARLFGGDLAGAKADAIALAATSPGAPGEAETLAARPAEGAVREASRRIGVMRAERARAAPEQAGVFLAATLAASGDDAGALDRLEHAVEARVPWLLPALRDPRFDRLRDQPRFLAIASRVRLPVATPLRGSPR